MRHLSVFASFLFFLFVVTVLAAAEPEFSYYENVTTFVPKNFSCGRGVTVSTCAPDETAFNGDRIALQKLFLGLWVGSDFKYPKLERIVIVGKTGRPTVYQGVAGKSWNWLPKDEGIPPSLVVADTGGRDSVSRSKLPKSVKNDDSLPSDRNILGTWYGSYTCEHGSVNVTLELEEIKRLVKGENLIQNIKGELAFYPQFGSTDNRGGKAEIGGSASFPQRSLMLNQRSWIKDPGNHPPIYFFGYVSFDGQRIFGNLRIPHCSDLPLTREKPATPQPTVAEKAVAGEIGSIVGTWKGSYVCSGDSIGMMLSISRAGEAGLSATFNFYPLTLDDASGPSGIPKGSFGLRGNYDELTQAFELKPTGWIEKPVRSGMAMIGMSGLLDETGSRLTGSVLHSRCAGFEATRYTKTVKVEPEKAAQPIPTALADAKTTYERCEVLLRWAGKMAKEYPDIDLDHTVLGKLYQKAVNLYSDEHFIPVFGTAFDRLDNAARKDITEKQLQCTNNVKAGHPERDHYRFLLNPIVQSPFFDKGSFGYESVASLVAERRSLRIWRGRVINGVKGMSDTPENHEKLEEYLEKGEKDLVELWPSEQKSFKETMLSRRAGMAESILEALYKDRQLPMTLESVKLVEEKGHGMQMTSSNFRMRDALISKPGLMRKRTRFLQYWSSRS